MPILCLVNKPEGPLSILSLTVFPFHSTTHLQILNSLYRTKGSKYRNNELRGKKFPLVYRQYSLIHHILDFNFCIRQIHQNSHATYCNLNHFEFLNFTLTSHPRRHLNRTYQPKSCTDFLFTHFMIHVLPI